MAAVARQLSNCANTLDVDLASIEEGLAVASTKLNINKPQKGKFDINELYGGNRLC
jgi:hypothetical protein